MNDKGVGWKLGLGGSQRQGYTIHTLEQRKSYWVFIEVQKQLLRTCQAEACTIIDSK